MGDWDGWAAPVVMNYDPATNVWKSATPVTAAEFKVRLNNAWDINYGTGTKPAENMEGIDETAAYELEQGGGNITTMPAGAHYVVLHADRTPYVIAYEPAQ